jgi:uncharacterized protein (TIGR03790 family)
MASPARVLLLLTLSFFLFCGAAWAQRKPGSVLLVYNANSPVSTAIAKDYEAKRHITHVIAVRCADSALNAASETIRFDDYRQEIAAPVSDYLEQHPEIDFIVLTKGMPLRISGALTGEKENGVALPSLDSYLAAIDYPDIPNAVKASLAGSGTTGTGWINRYYNATVPFSHAKFGGYLVTRLDGYTQADAMGLVDQALAAEHAHRDGEILLDIEPDFGLGDKTRQPTLRAAKVVSDEEAYANWNADMFHASDILEASGVPHDTNVTHEFVGGKTGLLGYFSWGSNDNHFGADAYQSLRFAPGSIADTAVSTSARTFLPTSGGQTLMADLIAHGVTCCQGYAGEPILDGISSPTIDLTHYLSGYTMAESFYAGTKYIGWEGVCVGDPLCCPYAGQRLIAPTMAAAFRSSSNGIKTEPCSESGMDVGAITNGSYTAYKRVHLTGITGFEARVAGNGPGGNIELRLGSPTGTLIGACAVPPTGDWQTWTTQECNLFGKVRGVHDLYLVFTGGSGNLFNVEWFALRSENDRHPAHRRRSLLRRR